MPEGVDPAPLVDFCNQNSPRAQPLISRSLAGASKVALLRAFQVARPDGSSGRDPRGPALGAAPRNRALTDPARSLWASTRLASLAICKQTPGLVRASWATPTELSQVRGRPLSADGASRAEHPEGCTQQELRPNPIHSGTSCRGTMTAPAGEPDAIGDPTRRPGSRRTCQGPPHPSLREEERDPPHPRCLPPMSCPRARGLDCPQVVDNLGMEPGASRTLARSLRP